jgi:paraquat-inducible protein B
MTTPSNHFKLGLFVLAAIAVAVLTAIALGARSVARETVVYHTYFNESVQGLEVGSPVKFRGVTIGVVAAIEIAPDKRHVDVVSELDVKDLRRMGLIETGKGAVAEPRFLVPPDLRAQLGSQGITGVKFVLIDFFDPRTNPAVELPFAAPQNHIPATPSLFKNLEDSIVTAVDRFPEIADALVAILTKIDVVIDDLEQNGIPDKAGAALDNLNGALGDVRKILRDVDREKVPARAAKAIANLDEAISQVRKVVARFDGDHGFVASATRASDAIADMGRSANGSTGNLNETLRDVSEAARALRDLAEALEQDPDMLLKGRAARSP